MKITPEIKKNREKWLRALESGRYKQGRRGRLADDEGKYCCLGVWLACTQAPEENDVHWGDGVYLTIEQRAWLGMSEETMRRAAKMNDNAPKRSSFREIAAYFRKLWRQPRG